MSIMFSLSTILIITNSLIAISASPQSILVPDENLIIRLLNPAGSTLKGHTLKTEEGLEYFGFHDIPYAESPVGKNRFNVPVYSKGWNGTLDATKIVKVCTQSQNGSVVGTEDCLVVNVYTPRNPNTSTILLPVLVWIHGGGFMSGSGGGFTPNSFMGEDIIVVTVNYRLGVLGFLSTQDKVIPGNFGFKDQQVAIKWTYNNIKAFGGNPHQITIGGGSAGAVSVGWHLLNVKQRITKFFRGAILASGTALVPFGSRPNAREEAFKYGYALDNTFKSNKSKDLLELLRNATAEKLISTMDTALFENPFIAAIECGGKDFSRPQTDSMDHGVFVKVPTLIGFNSEEMLNMWGNLDDVKRIANRSVVDTLLAFGYRMKNMQKMQKMASLLQKRYTNGSFPDDLPAFIRFSSDLEFTSAIFRHVLDVNRHCPEVSPYLYRISYKSSFESDSVVPGITGVSHGADMSLLSNIGNRTSTTTDKLMSQRFVRIWANFIKKSLKRTTFYYVLALLQEDLDNFSGFGNASIEPERQLCLALYVLGTPDSYSNPTPSPDPLLGNITWPKSKKSKLLTFLDFNEDLKFENNPRDFRYTSRILEKYLDRPIAGF